MRTIRRPFAGTTVGGLVMIPLLKLLGGQSDVHERSSHHVAKFLHHRWKLVIDSALEARGRPE